MIAWLSVAAAGPLELGLYRQAVAVLEATLEADDAPYLHARLGSALARSGRYADALAAFEAGVDSPYYERAGFADHALALRVHGRCAEAAAVRLEGRWQATEPLDEVRLLVAAADDYAACGLWPEAEALALSALAHDAGAPVALACLSDLARAQGRRGEAAWTLDAALSDPQGTLRPWLSLAEAELAAGRPEGALVALDEVLAETWRDPRATTLRLRALRAVEAWDEAERVVDRLPWPDHEDPDVLTERAAVLRALGRDAEADEAERRRALLY